jgi:hypothetical protein
MPCSVIRSVLLLLSLTVSASGCNYFQGAEGESDDEFAEFDRDEESDAADAEGKSDDETATDAKLTEGELELKLNVGDRFPLMKKIEQRLTQGDGVGGMIVNRSLVEMMLSLVVEEVRDGNKRLSVRYHRVHYGHNIAGRQVEYDSESAKPVPTEALVYAGLKDNGFSFWIGPDNRVVELVGFEDFLQRCVQNVPSAHRDAVMRQLEGTHSDDGLANFVDDSIGLLPYSNDPNHPAVAVKVGAAWELKPRRTEGPIPMSVSTRCVLKSLTDTAAEIGLIGNISGSSTPVTVQDGTRSMQVLIKGGHCAGSCTVDRRTGLPTQSEVNRYLEMTVKLPDGSEIPQRKEVLTSITSFLDQGSGRNSAIGLNPSSEFKPAGRTSFTGQDSSSNRVTQAVGTNPQPDGMVDRRINSRTQGGFDRSSLRQ